MSMTKEEAILLSAYTGFLLVPDFSDVHKFCEDTLGRPIWTHEFADQDVQKEIQEKLRPQIVELAQNISALRPVSREQVILCKDCQYWQGNNGGYPHPECRWGNDETPDEDDYCSFAERLEVNKNGSTWEEIRD